MTENAKKQEMSNDNLKLVMTKSSGCKIQLDVEVTPKAAQQAYKKALKQIKKEVSLPGFRKGKAPDQVILDNFKSHVEKEWSNITIFQAFKESLDLIKINPISQKAVKQPQINEKPSLETGAKIVFNFESYPEIPEIDFEKLQVEKVEEEVVSEEMINQIIEDMRLRQADWEKIEDRPAEKGDYVILDVENIDQDPPIKAYQNQKFAITDDAMNTWMQNMLIGLKIGDSAEGISEPTKDASAEEKKNFKPIKYKVNLKSIEKPILPELNDDFAKKLKTDSLDSLKEKTKKDLEEVIDRRNKEKQHNAIIKKLIETYSFDLPASVFNGEKENYIKDKIRAYKEQDISDENIKNDQKEIEKLAEKEITPSLCWTFLMQKISMDHKITVSHQDLVDAIVKNFGGMGNKQQLIDFVLNNKNLKSKCLMQAQEDKVKDFLIDKATFI